MDPGLSRKHLDT